MPSPRTREWSEHTEIAKAVKACGNRPLAAAHMGVTREGLRQMLIRGYVRDGRCAVRLAEAAEANGRTVNLRRLVGL